jgi:hypothetical protein
MTRTVAQHRRLAFGRVISRPVREQGELAGFAGRPPATPATTGTQRPWQPQPTQRAVRFGGAEGNERLTAMTGVVLVVLAVKRFTILRSYTGGMQHVTTGAPWRARS